MPPRKKKIYEEDLSVFDDISKKGAKRDITIDELLATAARLGFKIIPPTTEEEKEAHEKSVEKLGLKPNKSKKKKPEPIPSRLEGTLYFSHVVGTSTYGPGALILDLSEKDLFNSLMKQDQMCFQHFMYEGKEKDTRFFIIRQGPEIARNRFRKIEVSYDAFNNEESGKDTGELTFGNNSLPNGTVIPQYIPYPRGNF